MSDMEPNEGENGRREKRRLQLSVLASVLVSTKKVFREVMSGYAHVRHRSGRRLNEPGSTTIAET